MGSWIEYLSQALCLPVNIQWVVRIGLASKTGMTRINTIGRDLKYFGPDAFAHRQTIIRERAVNPDCVFNLGRIVVMDVRLCYADGIDDPVRTVYCFLNCVSLRGRSVKHPPFYVRQEARKSVGQHLITYCS